jgi:glucose uptake protein GlcU
MQKNMGTIDRVIRLIIAAVAVFLFYNGTLTGAIGIVALVVAAVFTLTSVISFCPLYRIVGLSTCPVSTGK